MPHLFHRPAGSRDSRRHASPCLRPSDGRPAGAVHLLAIPLIAFLLMAGGCATKSSPSVDRPAYDSGPKTVRSVKIVSSSKGAEVVGTARSLIGTPYKWGGRSPRSGFDCSGFVGYVYGRFGVELPRTSEAMTSVGRSVDGADLRPGDIVIYNISKKGKSLHVGIATGKGTFVHAPSSGKGVSESSMSLEYWREHFVGARRVF